MPIETERRASTGVDVRATNNGRSRMLVGYAAKYGNRTDIISERGQRFIEQIAPGAFRGILATNPDVVFTYNHNNDTVLGRTKSGTLRLTEDRSGLAFECDLPDTTLANDLHASVLRGDISECSFAFTAGPDDSDWQDEYVEGRGNVPVRTLKGFSNLFDISAVVRPAYKSGTSVAARGEASPESLNRPSVGLYSGRNGKGFRVTRERMTEWRNKMMKEAAERRKRMMDILLS